MKMIRITPLSIFLPIVLLGTILKIITNTWTAFSLVFIIVFILFAVLIFAFERSFTVNFSIKKVWISELIIILLAIFIYLKFHSKFYYIVNNETNWFAVIYTNKKSDIKVHSLFPFDKFVKIENKEVIQLNEKEIKSTEIIIKRASGNPVTYSAYNGKDRIINKDINCIIYFIYPYNLTDYDYNSINERINSLCLETVDYDF